MSDNYFSDDSEWNEAKALFYRIHENLNGSNHASLMKDYSSQLSFLFNVHREISGQMKTSEEEKARVMHRQIRSLISIKNMNAQSISDKLYEYELHLRTIMKDRKMDIPRRPDPGKAMFG